MKLTGALAALATMASAKLTVVPLPQSQLDDGKTYSLSASEFDFASTGANSDFLTQALDRATAVMFGPRMHANELHSLRSLLAQGFLPEEEFDILVAKLLSAPNQSIGFEWYKEAGDLELADGGAITGCDVSVTSDEQIKTLDTDESYKLTILPPRIQITAQTVFGAMYGLETLSQLVDAGLSVDGTQIADSPRFQFRATMIDTSRHWLELKFIKQHIDAMAYSKFNVLHWHLVDSISFPFQSTSYPKMSIDGAYLPNEIYTHDDVKEIVQYGLARGVRTIPEFDTPGHVYRGWESLGVLTQCYDADGNEADTGPLDPTLDLTYEVLSNFYEEVKEVFAPETFVHVGGDEVPDDCWSSNPEITKWMEDHPEVEDFAGLETQFEQKLLTDLKSKGMSYMIWQEIFDNGADILDDTVIDVWKGGWEEEMANVTAAGYHAVLSAPFYLNYINYGMDWVSYYQTEPANFTGGEAAEESGLFAGIEACFWSEFIDATNLAQRAWPRASAVAERAWSVAEDTTDLVDAQERLNQF